MANKYLRAGASGTATGADWTNAYTTLAALESGLARGDTGYVADGSYTGGTFDTAVSGTTRITIKKATVADHGTSTGWLDSYGDGQAEFTTQFTVNTGYWTFDGVSRGADWKSSYGFKISIAFGSGSFGAFRITDAGAVNSIVISYIEMQGPSLSDSGNLAAAVYSFTPGTSAGLTIQYCWTHDFWPDVFTLRGDDITIEYCAIDPNFSTALIHGQTIADHGCSNVIFRYNKVSDPWGTAVYTVIGNGQTESVLKVYGNAIYAPAERAFPDGVSKFVTVISPATVSNIEVYNNTLANIGWCVSLAHADATGSNRVARNNFYDTCGDCSHLRFDSDYNYYRDTVHDAETNEQIGLVNILANAVIGNVTLTANTNPGQALGAEFDEDMRGVLRSTWSRGALEYGTPVNVTTLNATTLRVG